MTRITVRKQPLNKFRWTCPSCNADYNVRPDIDMRGVDDLDEKYAVSTDVTCTVCMDDYTINLGNTYDDTAVSQFYNVSVTFEL